MKHAILIIAFAFSSVIGFSQENALEETIKKQIGYNDEDFFSFELKTIPEITNTVVALAVKYQEKDEEEQTFTADLYLYLINTKDVSLIYGYIEEGKFISNAIKLETVAIDSSSYKISKKETALSLKVSYDGPSRAFPYYNEYLFLYSISNNQIKAIAEGIETKLYRAEWDMNCNLDGEETETVVKVDTKKTNGFYNLKVIRTKTILKNTPPLNENDNCIETKTVLKPETKTLVFRNWKYVLE